MQEITFKPNIDFKSQKGGFLSFLQRVQKSILFYHANFSVFYDTC